MDKNIEGAREDAISFLVDHSTGVLATVSISGQPRARHIYYTCDDDFNVYFITLKNTRKVSDIASDNRGAFVVADDTIPRTLQIEGTISDLSDTATIDPLLSDFVHRLMSHKKYGIPLSHFDASELMFFKLSPTWIRWGEFTFAKGTEAVLTELDPRGKDQY